MSGEKDSRREYDNANAARRREAEERAKTAKRDKWKYIPPKRNIFKEPPTKLEIFVGLGFALAIVSLITYLAFPDQVTCSRDAFLSFRPTVEAIQLLFNTLPACFR